MTEKRAKAPTTITRALLLPLLLAVSLTAAMPLAVLLVSDAGGRMVQNTVDLDRRAVENHAVVLENDMVGQWSGVRKDVSAYEKLLEDQLSESGMGIEAFLGDAASQRAYVASVYRDLLGTLKSNGTSGVFIVMANADATSSASRHVGFFLRDSDPSVQTQTNSDLLVERGEKSLAQDLGVALDNSWSPTINLAAAGERASDDFYYEPLAAGEANPGVDASSLGYWSAPFILEDSSQDGHRMITYSLPLRHGGKVFAVLGIEVSTDYLGKSYFSTNELSDDGSAAYALAYEDSDGTYRCVGGKGVLYDYAAGSGGMALSETGREGLYLVEEATLGSQSVYALKSDITLFDSHVPYEHTRWAVIGLVSENSVFGASSGLFQSIVGVTAAALVLGVGVMYLAVRGVTRPLHLLMESVRGGVEGLRAFVPSGILEVNELHDVVAELTAKEASVAGQLAEEKERYRQAIESSSDIFFTYRRSSGELEIVNSRGDDGVYTREQWWGRFAERYFSAGDLALFKAMQVDDDGYLRAEVKGSVPGFTPNGWVQLVAHVAPNEDSERGLVVGYLRDINERKEREIADAYAQVRDPASGFYSREPGLEVIRAEREGSPIGTLVLFDFCRFFEVVSDYGLTFGDVLINEFAEIAREEFGWSDGGVVLVRAGGDEFLIWAAGLGERECADRVARVRARYGALVRRDAADLRFTVGMVGGGVARSTTLLAERACIALQEAKRRGLELLTWESVSGSDIEPRPFGEIASHVDVGKMSLSSMALNLLDRRFSLTAALDLIARRLEGRFGLSNLIVTQFSEEHLGIAVTYQWRSVRVLDGGEGVLRCAAADAECLQAFADRGSLAAIGDVAPVGGFKSWSAESTVDGVVYFMTYEGRYSGSIVYKGVDSAAILGSDEDANALWELSGIIQSRINQERLDQYARAKSDFLARMSHEIRTPMNGIIGMTEIALKPGQAEERRIDCLQKVRSSSHYLLGLLNDILDMSKIESGKMGLVAAEFDLKDLVEDLGGVLGARFEGKGQRLVCDVRLEHTRYIGDAMRLNQVLINLLGNANKYSGEGTEVLLCVEETCAGPRSSVLSFAVTDHGIGVGPEDMQRIFEKFEQVGTNDARRQGTGLGLAISNRLVRLMGGRIELVSELGRGSTFSFAVELPIAADDEGAAGPAGDAVASGALGVAEAGEGTADLKGLQVLVAEDNELNMEILRCLLEDQGCVVEEAANGLECVERFKASEPGHFGLIVMDVMMPVMDGLEAAYAIRALDRPDASAVPIVAASANAFEEDVNRSIAAGMNAHISKPIEVSALLAALAEVL